jgi:acetyl-CoA carboxylase carboxyl transferase subunit alpha
VASSAFDFEKQIVEMEEKLAMLKAPGMGAQANEQGIDLDVEIAKLTTRLGDLREKVYGNLSPWEKTLMARHKDRPYSLNYINLIFDGFFPLDGDRLASNDEAVVGGLAWLGDKPVVVIGQQKGRDIKERQRRNFGMARAEGYRKALRLAKLAEKFKRPLICFVDTAGAAADLRAEQHGISEAIARNLREFAVLDTPTIAIIIGEGGSGGAIGMGVADRVLMLEHSVYSVISPEGCAAILWRDRERGAEAAEALKLTAQGAKKLGVIDEVLPEPLGGAHRDSAVAAATIQKALNKHLGQLCKMSSAKLLEIRYQKLRGLGSYVTLDVDSSAAGSAEPAS